MKVLMRLGLLTHFFGNILVPEVSASQIGDLPRAVGVGSVMQLIFLKLQVVT